ncbi:putative leader peptide [Actinomycetospora aurantiaca]
MGSATPADVWHGHGRATLSSRRHIDLVRVGSSLCR